MSYRDFPICVRFNRGSQFHLFRIGFGRMNVLTLENLVQLLILLSGVSGLLMTLSGRFPISGPLVSLAGCGIWYVHAFMGGYWGIALNNTLYVGVWIFGLIMGIKKVFYAR